MRTQVFTYNGWIGIKSDIKAEGLLNDPMKSGQLGFVVDANFVDISPEVLELLKKIKTSNDDIGDVDIFKSERSSKIIFCWLGGPLKMFKPELVTGSNNYDASLITETKEIEIDPEFIKIATIN